MLKEINKIIENDVIEDDLEYFSVIIGENPSTGARSPTLWNKVYDAEKKRAKMIPLDVSKERLKDLFHCLQDHPRCVGGAIAVPYKEDMFNFVKDSLSKEIRNIGAINCFYRQNENGLFTGTNTDGEGSLEAIKPFLSKTGNKKIALVGYGGAGKAVLAFLLRSFGDKHSIYVYNRSPISEEIKKKIPVDFFKISMLEKSLADFDLIINATTLGSKNSLNETPIDKKVLVNVRKKAIIYDIIYDPPMTTLLKCAHQLGLNTINGIGMNLVQAVLAFQYANETNFSQNKIFEIMSS